MAILISSEHSFGTSVVLVIRPDEIVIAADGKATIENSFGMEGIGQASCKIGTLKNFAWADAGVASEQFPKIELLKRADETPGTLEAKYDAFVASARKALSGLLWKGEIFQIAILAFRNGRPQLLSAAFIGDGNGTVAMPPRAQYKCVDCTHPQPFELGYREALGAWYQDPYKFNNASPIMLATQLLKLEMQLSWDVGPPVSVIRITPRRSEWKQTGACVPSNILIYPPGVHFTRGRRF